ncbi:MAG: hypothetical protein IKP31_01300 [Lachnospiraceae bacterium]|nr:hypothetical protein [Lachnospiraceae bacterium]
MASKSADMIIQINVSAPALENAIKALTDAIAGNKVEQTSPSVKVDSIMPAPVPAEAPAPAPQAQPIPTVAPAPAPAPAPVQQTVPTAAPVQQAQPVAAPAPAPVPVQQAAPATPAAITLEAICAAGAQLIQTDPENMQKVLNILPKYGVPAINLVKPEQYEAVATDLRALGATI